jgi:LuxR family maltose regulon positive regulatory protein
MCELRSGSGAAEARLGDASDRPGAQVRERDVLLATKLRVPRRRRDVLVRPRLLDRVEEAAARELLLVSAPAGFGKSTLLTEWARATTRPVGWVSLDADDNDPVRLWRYVVAAVEQVHPGLEERVLPLLDTPDQPTSEAVVTAVVNELTAGPSEFTVVLDDYHVIESPALQTSIAFLLERLPPGMHVVIAGRSDPPLPLARMRARGQLAEVRAEDLRFTREEAVALLRQVWGLDLPEQSVAMLEERTEGWVTGLQLAALSLRAGSDPAGLIRGFSGGHRYVLDYLTGEVLERQPAHVRRFLLDTSILERLCGPLCDAVTGRSDGQQLLEGLERANLFLVALDGQRRWYRYHRLFADLLRVRVRQEGGAERVAGLHRRAAAWSADRGLVDDAVRHAMAAGEAGWAARIVEHRVDEVLRRGEGATLRRWLSALPEEVVRARPRLCLAQAVAAFNEGRLEAVEPLLEDVERGLAAGAGREDPYQAPASGGEDSALANIPVSVALLRASLAGVQGDAERAIRLVEEAQTHLAEGERGPLLAVRWNLGFAHWLQGRLAEAERTFADFVAQGRGAGPPHLALSAGALLGRVQRAQGRLGAALRTYQEGLELAARPGRPVVPTTGAAHIGMAEVLYERDRLDEAQRHVDEGIALCRQLTSTQPLAAGLAALAWIRQAAGDASGALEAMREARRTFPNPDTVSLYNPVPASWARLLLGRGEVAEAAGWIEARGLKATDAPTYPQESEYLVLARVLLAREAPAPAVALLERIDALAEAQGRTAGVIEALALQALGLHAAGDRAGALAMLVRALTLAWPEGYVRVFADEGPAMGSLVGAVIGAGRRARPPGADQIPMDYLGRLLRAVRPAPAGARPDTQPHTRMAAALVEPLTDREFKVLGMLAAGKRNQEIADELVVTLGTVKKHVTHTFEKLGAASRTQAVARARQLGLIP